MNIGGLGKEGINHFLFLVNCGYFKECRYFKELWHLQWLHFKSCGYYGDYHKKVLLHQWLPQGIVANSAVTSRSCSSQFTRPLRVRFQRSWLRVKDKSSVRVWISLVRVLCSSVVSAPDCWRAAPDLIPVQNPNQGPSGWIITLKIVDLPSGDPGKSNNICSAFLLIC